MKEVRENARKLMGQSCRVCPVCKGTACAGEVPGMGGLGTGSSFQNNFKSLSNVCFNMRLIHDVVEPNTEITVLGKKLSIPVMAAPIGGISYNMNSAITEEAYINAIVHGCKAKGIIGCTGDGVPEPIHQCGFAAATAADKHAIPFIKPWDDDELFRKIELAKETGVDTIGMDIDAAGLITLRLMGRPVSPKTPEKLKEIIKKADRKFILKGVMTPDEAELAIEAGANAIVVSNHGGRVLDSTPGTAFVLPKIAEKVAGRITIFVDGGVRTGGDVLKMLALGADCVMIGRPFSIAAVGGLQEGVEKYIDQLTTELKQAMVMTGTPSIDKITKEILCCSPSCC